MPHVDIEVFSIKTVLRNAVALKLGLSPEFFDLEISQNNGFVPNNEDSRWTYDENVKMFMNWKTRENRKSNWIRS